MLFGLVYIVKVRDQAEFEELFMCLSLLLFLE